jgi:hypothetical protein
MISPQIDFTVHNYFFEELVEQAFSDPELKRSAELMAESDNALYFKEYLGTLGAKTMVVEKP